MSQGVPTPEHQVSEFRAHYLYSGNASESARATGLDERTGRDLARKLVGEFEFSEARRQLREGALQELVAARMRVVSGALERFESETGGIEIKRLGVDELAPVTIIDKRADYGKLVLEAEKNAHNLARFDAEKSGQISPERQVTINVVPMKPTDDDDGKPNGGG